MRRVFAILTATLVGLWLTVLPALAVETAAKEAEADEINGIVLALILGVIVGVGLFLDSYGKSAPAVSDDAHGDH